MDLTAWKWRMEETWTYFFFVYLILASPKNASCLFCIFYARSIKPAAAMLMSSSFFFYFPWSNTWCITSLQLSADCGQDRTLKRLENACFLSDVCVCVCVDSSFNFISVLFCQLVWIGPNTFYPVDVRRSRHHSINYIEITNRMQLFTRIYYSNVY